MFDVVRATKQILYYHYYCMSAYSVYYYEDVEKKVYLVLTLEIELPNGVPVNKMNKIY